MLAGEVRVKNERRNDMVAVVKCLAEGRSVGCLCGVCSDLG
jgi:hypothetical protein